MAPFHTAFCPLLLNVAPDAIGIPFEVVTPAVMPRNNEEAPLLAIREPFRSELAAKISVAVDPTETAPEFEMKDTKIVSAWHISAEAG